MKTLMLVRHAKSSWTEGASRDLDRPLEARGERDAARMGKRLSQRGPKPDLVVTSPAVRAQATARILAEACGCKPRRIVVDERLYPGTASGLAAVIDGLDDACACVMLVGHNPGMTDLVQGYASEITHLPTCAIVALSFDAEAWSAVGRARPATTHVDFPKRSA